MKVLGIRFGTLFILYGWRLRRHPMQEVLAACGIAVGVALFLGVLVANTAINGSAGELEHQLVGSAKLQLQARSAQGFDERTAAAAGKLPGVQISSRLLRESAVIVGPRGRQIVQMIGVTPTLVSFGSSATRNLGVGDALLQRGLGVPQAVAEATGLQGGEIATVLSNGETHAVVVRIVLGSQTVGSVSGSPIAIGLLSVVQRLTGKAGRVTSVLVKPSKGNESLVKRELEKLAAGRLDVESPRRELTLLNDAAAPTQQSTTLFAAISAMVGFLLALNAMLLTVPERRRFIAGLRTDGFDPPQIIVILVFQAIILGLIASLGGIGLGIVLSRTLFHQVPSYLTFAFPIDSQEFIRPATLALALACGVGAATLASLAPILGTLEGTPREPGTAQRIGARVTRRLALVGLTLLGVVSALLLTVPSLTVLGGVLLAFSALLLIPAVFALSTAALAPASERSRRSMLGLAVPELGGTTTRSVALAGVAALAVYGSIAIQGARGDLTTGLSSSISQYLKTADIWVTTGDNVFTTDSFSDAGASQAIARAPGVSSVRLYQGALLDVGPRRLWIRARPPQDTPILQASQLQAGNLSQASRRIREGGWAAVSAGFADEHDLHLGSAFALPTPSGSAPLRVAAITTNTGWPSGAITLSRSDFTRYWQTRDPAALEVNLKPGVSLAQGRREVRAAIGRRPGLWVQTRPAREAQFRANARQALRGMAQISTLLLVAAALAIAFALSTALWQRRPRLVELKIQGFDDLQLWRSLVLETIIVLSVGCLDGLVLGVYGHTVASRWLRLETGFPAPFSIQALQVFLTLVLICGIAVLAMAIPGYAAARISAATSFQD